MAIIKLLPSCKETIWGGTKLKTRFNKVYGGDTLGETWELSCHRDGESVISGGPQAGMPLSGYIRECGAQVLGTNCRHFEMFPVLIKLIDTKQDLSIQVHPDDGYALEKEGQYGKTELWYVVDCEEGAAIYYGFSREVTKEEVRRLIAEGRLTEALGRVLVKPGDVFFIPAGTIHAIGAGITIAEIQQNSNLTYRVYDYGRKGADGQPRKLHVEEALEVALLEPPKQAAPSGGHLGLCRYFQVDLLQSGNQYSGYAAEDTFHHLLILEGTGEIANAGEHIPFQKGDSIFLPAGSGAYRLEGACSCLLTTIPEA